MYSRIIIYTITHTNIACKVGRGREGGGREGGRGRREGGRGGREKEREGERNRGRDGGREGGRNTFLYQRQLDEKRTPSHTSLLLLFHLVSHSLSTHAYQSIWQHSTCVCIEINDRSVLAIMPSIAELSSQ